MELNVQETLIKATKAAINSPYQDIENVLELVIARKIGVNTISGSGSQISNYDVLLDIFMNEANLQRIAKGREETLDHMRGMDELAEKDPEQIELQSQVSHDMCWSISDKVMGYPFISNKVEDCFHGEAPQDGVYTASYNDSGYFRGDLTSPQQVRIENGKVNIGDVCSVFGNDFADHDDHIFIESLTFVDGKIKIDCGS